MSKGKVQTTLQRPTQVAQAVAEAYGRQLPAYERRVLIRRGRVLASGQQRVLERK